MCPGASEAAVEDKGAQQIPALVIQRDIIFFPQHIAFCPRSILLLNWHGVDLLFGF